MTKRLLVIAVSLLSTTLLAQVQLTNENTDKDFGSIGTRSNRSAKTNTGFFEFDNKFFFAANTPEFGTEIWYSDGTPNSSQLLKDIGEGAISVLTNNGLWKSDGTENGTLKIKDLEDETILAITPLSSTNFLFFTRNNATGISSAWRSDGTESNTIKYLTTLDIFSPINLNCNRLKI